MACQSSNHTSTSNTLSSLLPTVNVKVAYQDSHFLVISLSDNGTGITQDDLDRIWKFSYTTAKETNGSSSSPDFELLNPLCGLGYGLPMSRILLQTMGSDIRIGSTFGQGTTNYLLFDLVSDWKV